MSVTEEDKERFISALKLSINPLAAEYLKRFFNIEKEEYKFQPFDKVLVRDNDGVWFAGFFSHYSKNGYFCVLEEAYGNSAFHTTTKQNIC